MPNERLRSALTARALTVDAAAARLEVDPKTVQRWLAGRTPHARHRRAIVVLVGEDETYLWPTAMSNRRQSEASRAELIALYPHRADVPPSLWRTLFDQVRQDLDILVYAAVFLPEQQVDLVDLLRAKAVSGCRIRIALGDPNSPKLLERGREENFGIGIVSRAEVALKHYESLRDCLGVEVRLHGATLYNSIYRFDDVMLVNTHVWGLSAFGAPVLYLRRLVEGGVFDTYAQSLEAVWSTAMPAYPHSE
jgi:hypothetical protein